MNEQWTVRLHHEARADIDAIKDSRLRQQIRNAIRKKLTTDPVQLGKQLQGGLYPALRITMARYRIIYLVDESTRRVLVVSVRHRKAAYSPALNKLVQSETFTPGSNKDQ